MEYRRAYRDEQPDGWLVERHEREIFPLFHRRYLFAEVDRLPACTTSTTRRRLGQRGRLRLLEPARRRARPGRLPQPLRRGEGLDQDVGGLLRARRERRAAADPEVSRRGAGTSRRWRLVDPSARAALRARVPAQVVGPVPRRAVRGAPRLRVPGLPGHPRSRGRAVRSTGAAGRANLRRRSAEHRRGPARHAAPAAARRHPWAHGGADASASGPDRGGSGGCGLPGPSARRPGSARSGQRERDGDGRPGSASGAGVPGAPSGASPVPGRG